MATKIVRAKAIIESLTDATVTNALALRIADAYAFTYARGQTLTNEQKAGVFIQSLRTLVKQVVRDAEISTAMEAARLAAAPGAEIEIGID